MWLVVALLGGTGVEHSILPESSTESTDPDLPNSRRQEEMFTTSIWEVLRSFEPLDCS